MHNGVLIHKMIDLSGPTQAVMFDDEIGGGLLMLQDHGNKVQFRNMWVTNMK